MINKYALNKIFLIESIPINEPQTGEEIFKDSIKPYNDYYNAKIQLEFKKVTNKEDFLNAVNTIYESVNSNDKIILHIEAHGSSDKKKLVLSNDDIISWQELTEILTPINSKLKNNLHLFNVSCFGNYISQLIDLTKTAPFRSFIGSKYEIYPHEIISYYTSLYDRILKLKDPYKAVHEIAKIDIVEKFFMKDLEFLLTGITYGHLQLFFQSGSLSIIKQMFDSRLNINIDINEMQKHEDPKIYIIDLFRKRFFYWD
ncbi:hypothetical protein [Confluentibacter sediminis]|uniref:hypothetical protein n=1 Tax=Confluentibacter sediminis TaxID=2219045 RepID=UPI000DACA834|nr:hypothetical protein [Confluentibacter sediminis]